MTALRPGLAERRRRRIAHVLRQVAGADEEHVDAFDREHLVDVARWPPASRPSRPPAASRDRPAGVANRLDDRAGLVRGIDHRHHQAVCAGIEVADQERDARCECGRTIAAPPAPRTTCAAMRTSSKPHVPCSQSTKMRVGAKLHQPHRRGQATTWCGLNMVIALAGLTAARAVSLRSWPFLPVYFFGLSGVSVRRADPARGLDIGRGIAHEGRADMQFGDHRRPSAGWRRAAPPAPHRADRACTARSLSSGGRARLSMIGVLVSPGRIVVARMPWLR